MPAIVTCPHCGYRLARAGQQCPTCCRWVPEEGEVDEDYEM